MKMAETISPEAVWSILDRVQEGVLLVEQDGSILYSNQAAQQILSPDEPFSLSNIASLFPTSSEYLALLTPPASVMIPIKETYYRFSSQSFQPGDNDVIQLILSPQREGDGLDARLLEQLSGLTRLYREPDLDRKLTAVVHGLKKMGWDAVELSLRSDTFYVMALKTTAVAPSPPIQKQLPPQFWQELFEAHSAQQYKYGSCYFVPSEAPWWETHGYDIGENHSQPSVNQNGLTWQQNDLLCIPLLNTKQQRIGLITLGAPTNGKRPSATTLQALTLYAQFAASLIENSQLIEESLAKNRELEVLFNTSQALSSTLDKKEVLTILGQYMLQSVEADGYTIYRWHERQHELALMHEFATKAIGEAPTLSETAVHLPKDSKLTKILNQRSPKIMSLDKINCLPHPKWVSDPEEYQSAFLPLVRSEETYGLIQIIKHKAQRQMGDRELQLLKAISNQASTALETALIFEDTYEREQFYNALGHVNLAINFTLDKKLVLDLICSEALHIFNVDGAYIWQLEKKTFVGCAAQGHAAKQFINRRFPVSESSSFASFLLERNETRFVNNISTSDLTYHIPDAENVQSVLGIPLAQEGETIGLLILTDLKNKHRFTHKDVSWGSLYGVQVSIALQNANLIDELRRFNEELDSRVAERTQKLNQQNERVHVLLRITTELSRSLDQDRVMAKALALVNEVANATQGIIMLINQPDGELYYRAALGEESMPISNKGVPSGLMSNQGLAGWIIDNRSSVIVHDTAVDPRWLDLPNSRVHRSVLGLPLISNDDVFGVLMLFHNEPSAFTHEQLDLVEAASIQVANAINNASLYQLISDQAERLGSSLRNEIIQKANLEAVLESIADGVLVADEQNRINMVNLSACTILDMPRDQFMNRSINELLGLFGHFKEPWLEAIEDWSKNSDRVETGAFLADELHIEDKVINVKLSPVISDNLFYGTVSIFRDITKEVEVERLKNEFVSTVSHELRTPMTSIKGYADLMLMGAAGTLAESQNQFLRVIKSNAERLHMLVNDLLDISRIETGKTALDLRPLDIPQLIEQIVNNHLIGRIHDEGKELTVEQRFDASLPLVSADQWRVSQILTNLLDNAFNYTPENGKIIILASNEGDFVSISIKDNGIGISEDNLSKIFDRFYRSEDEKVQKVSGTGLGLAIVHSLVDMHGGELKVESKLGEGSQFTFSLPVVVEDGDPTYG